MLNNIFKNKITIYIILMILGIAGLLAALILSIEKYHLLSDPTYSLSCKISQVLDCTKVISSPEAAVFGFPNSYLGIVGYSAISLFGILMIFVKYYIKENDGLKKLESILFKIGLPFASLAIIFSLWLLDKSVYKYGTLCPYCLISAFVSINAFVIFLYNNIILKYRKYFLYLAICIQIMLVVYLYIHFS